MEINSILLPTDFSDNASFALDYAASLARLFKASIICLHVIEPMMPAVGYAGLSEPLPMTDVNERLEESATRELPRIAIAEECRGLEVSEIISHGDAASEIVRVAEEHNVDLIVIASHGRTGLGRILFGSTAESVV